MLDRGMFIAFPFRSLAYRIRRSRRLRSNHWEFRRFAEQQAYVRAWDAANR